MPHPSPVILCAAILSGPMSAECRADDAVPSQIAPDCGGTAHGGQAQETERDSVKPRRRCVQAPSTPWFILQTVQPLHDLKQHLDGRSGFGIGVHWLREHSERRASRTRLEWNTFAEGSQPQDPRYYVKNYGLGWDHLSSLGEGRRRGYLVTGVGVSRWLIEQSSPSGVVARWTTKLSLTGGLGFRLAEGMSLEARYVITSLDRTFDANSLVLSLGWRP